MWVCSCLELTVEGAGARICTSLTLQPLLFFFFLKNKSKGNPEKSKGFSLRGTPKFLGKGRKNAQKTAREIGNRKKQGNRKKARVASRAGRCAFGRVWSSLNLSGTEKVPQRTFATKISPNFRVNFLVRFASKPLVLMGNDR